MTLTSPFAGLYAVIAAEDGDRGPLAARLRNPVVTLSIWERNYVADVFKPRRRGPRTGEAQAIRARSESLEVARTVIRLSNGYARWHIKNAKVDAAEQHRCTKSKLKDHIRVAQRFLGGEWWRANCRLARKGKGYKLL
jgi:hypothetical protein